MHFELLELSHRPQLGSTQREEGEQSQGGTWPEHGGEGSWAALQAPRRTSVDMFTYQEVAPGSDCAQILAWIARLRKEPCHSTLLSITRQRFASVTYFSPHSCAIQTNSKRSQTPVPLKNGVLDQTAKKGATVAHGLCICILEVEKKTLFEKEDREEERRELASGEKVAGLDPLGSDLSWGVPASVYKYFNIYLCLATSIHL